MHVLAETHMCSRSRARRAARQQQFCKQACKPSSSPATESYRRSLIGSTADEPAGPGRRWQQRWRPGCQSGAGRVSSCSLAHHQPRHSQLATTTSPAITTTTTTSLEGARRVLSVASRGAACRRVLSRGAACSTDRISALLEITTTDATYGSAHLRGWMTYEHVGEEPL